MSYTYKVAMWVSGVGDGELDAIELDGRIYRQTKHSAYVFTVGEILEVEEAEDE